MGGRGPRVTRIDDEGIHVSSRDEVVLDVRFDGRRIWSFWLHRDASRREDGHLMAWPVPLRPFLKGTTHLTIATADEVVFDAEVVLGGGGGRIAVVNSAGRELAFDKSLRLVQTFDTRTREHVEPLMRAIAEVLGALQEAGTDAFIAYGTLLGAVREGRLIAHDSDADLAYLSRHEHPVDVIRESFALQRALVRRGFTVTRYSGIAFKVEVRESDGSVRGLDVFGGFLLDGELNVMASIRAPFRREWLLPLGEVELEGHTFPAPRDTGRFLAATYGPGWRVPDPAFKYPTTAASRRRFDGWFRGLRPGRTEWDRIHADTTDPDLEPSDLARAVLAAEPEAGLFVDVGCGSGADTRWLALQGVPAVGLDFAPRGFHAMASRVAEERVDARFLTFNLSELRSVLPTAALVARYDGPRVLIARHLVDAVGVKARLNLWRAGDMMTRGGGRMHLEFMSEPGGGYGIDHHVERRPVERIERELRASGASILSRDIREAGTVETGSPAKICRMVVRWGR